MSEAGPKGQDYRLEHAVGVGFLVLSKCEYVLAIGESILERPAAAMLLGALGVGSGVVGRYFRNQGVSIHREGN